MRAALIAVAAAGATIGTMAAALPVSTGTGSGPGADGTAVASVGSTQAADTDALSTRENRSCSTPRVLAARNDVDVSEVDAGRVRIDGVVFTFTAQKWKAATPDKPTISQAFHTSAWVYPLLRDTPAVAVELLLEQARMRPDTGLATRSERVSSGWSESQVTKRMWTVLCAWQLTKDERLIPVLETLAVANLDPDRYYGPPRRAPHNHGVFANEVLLAAGQSLGRDDWASAAVERLAVMSREVFEPCGMTYEQSATYQALNVRLWQRLTRRIDQLEGRSLNDARTALAAVARPDGVIEPIGDGFWGVYNSDELDKLGVTPGGSVWCNSTGWWANHQRLDTGEISHVVARFGPRPALHGDNDRTSVTWWVGEPGRSGQAVLSERGMFSKQRDWRYDFVNSDAAHSILSRVGAPFERATAGKRLSRDGLQMAEFTADQRDGELTRVLAYATAGPILAVSDTVTGSTAGSGFVQYWQLAPGWKPGRGHTAVTDEGDTLDIACLVNGKPVKVTLTRGWSFPAENRQERAYTASCRTGAAAQTRFDTLLAVNSDTFTVAAPRPRGNATFTTDYGTFTVDRDRRWRAVER